MHAVRPRARNGLASIMSTPPIDWFPLSVLLDPSSSSVDSTEDRLGDSSVSQHHRLEVTNPSVPLPYNSVRVLPDFVSGEQAARLSAELSDERYQKYSRREGYDGPKRKTYVFDFGGDDDDDKNANERAVPNVLVELQQHLKKLTGLKASSVKIEEYSPIKHKVSGRAGQAALYDPTITSTFASPKLQGPFSCCQEFRSKSGPKERESSTFSSGCSCFVLEVPLLLNDEDGDVDLLQNWNLPANREAVCWQLRSPLHWTDVRLRTNTAIVKQSELLRDWRSSRVLTTSPNIAGNMRVLKFYSLAKNSPANAVVDEDFSFGYVPSPDDENQRIKRLQEPMPPLKDLLTIIVTTSPIKSNPSTEVLERAMQTFELGGAEFAYECPKIIVCDGFRTQENGADEQLVASGLEAKVTRKHNNAKQAMRNGIVDRDQADNYRQFKRNLRDRCLAAAARSVTDGCEAPNDVFRTATVVELEERHGYGFALRHALRHCVATPFVCVIQHDRTFMRPTPVYETVKAMWRHSKIKYVGFTMRSNLMYRDLFLGKYGSGPQQEEEWNSMVLHVPELRVSASEYGPDSASTRAMTVGSEKIRKSIASLVSNYRTSHQAATAQPAGPQAEEENGSAAATPLSLHEQQQLTLIPTLFWYDNIHICDTKHYRDFIFHEPFKMVARGGFVEDKLSPVIKRTVERMGLRDGHSRFGCYLLDDHSGMFFSGHLDGGSYVTEEQRKKVIALQKKKQAEDPS